MASSPSVDFSSQLLRRLHQFHQQQADLEGQVRRGPLQLKALQTMVDEAQAKVDSAAESLKKTRMMSDEKQLQLQSREAHVEDLKAKLNVAASNKEFTLLKEQIAADQQANSVQNDEIFEVLERLDILEAEVSTAKQGLAEAEQEKAKREQEIESRQAQVKIDLERVELKLAETEAQIPAAIRADYKRLVGARGEEALAPIEADSCGGCSQTLTTQIVDQVTLNKLTYCPNCNAILYAAADNRV